MPGIFYVVATPLGNLKDTSERAIQTLRTVSRIFCEDTRVTRRLAEAYGALAPMESYHQHSGPEKIARIAGLLASGNDIALVTDAGTPGLSDPGSWLIHELLEIVPDARVVPIPGPSAAITALSVSGFPADRFVFLGFPPAKKGRKVFFENALQQTETVVMYEAVHRIMKTLSDLIAAGCKDRPCVVGREMTKLHETFYRGTVAHVLELLQKEKPRGEYAIVLKGK